MILNIYDRKNLEIVAKPTVNDLEHFNDSPVDFFPGYNPDVHIASFVTFQNPTIRNGVLDEMTKDELYKKGLYQLAENELIEDGKIKLVNLSEFEYVENNTIKLKREEKINSIKKELYDLRLEYDVKPFEFTVDGTVYLQNNRSIDQSNLTRIVVMCQAMKKTTFENWKFYTKDNSEKYVNISLQDMMEMANIMQAQTTKSMATETLLSHSLDSLTDEELKNYNAKEKYGEAYNSVN